MAFKRLANAGSSRRDWYVARLHSVANVSALQNFPSHCFVLLLTFDSRNESAALLASVAEHLLRAGAVYVCCHGTGCERLHDIFDEVAFEVFPEKTIMTTWHEAEPLQEVLEFAIDSAQPDEEFIESCRSGIIVNVSSLYEDAKIDLHLTRKGLEDAI